MEESFPYNETQKVTAALKGRKKHLDANKTDIRPQIIYCKTNWQAAQQAAPLFDIKAGKKLKRERNSFIFLFFQGNQARAPTELPDREVNM